MNLKIKINTYKKIIDEVTKEYESSGEFIRNKINELCSEHGMSTEEVRLYILCLLCYVPSLATYTVQSESFSH